MLAQMTYACIAHVALQAGGRYGGMNDFNAAAQNKYPGKFTGLMHVDEATADRPEVLAEVDRAHKVLGLKGVYYSHDFSRHGYARNLDHAAFAPFWEKVAGFRLPVFVELSATPAYDRASYIDNLLALNRVIAPQLALCFGPVISPPLADIMLAIRWKVQPKGIASQKHD